MNLRDFLSRRLGFKDRFEDMPAEEPGAGPVHIVDDSVPCWCNPRELQPCPECLDTHPAPSCWRCGGNGLVETFDPDAPCVIVHRDADEILRGLQ